MTPAGTSLNIPHFFYRKVFQEFLREILYVFVEPFHQLNRNFARDCSRICGAPRKGISFGLAFKRLSYIFLGNLPGTVVGVYPGNYFGIFLGISSGFFQSIVLIVMISMLQRYNPHIIPVCLIPEHSLQLLRISHLTMRWNSLLFGRIRDNFSGFVKIKNKSRFCQSKTRTGAKKLVHLCWIGI